jgi:hypothetical protein
MTEGIWDTTLKVITGTSRMWGMEAPVARIEAGQLVRVSLAGWWRPREADPGFEERCYAQLSGWF